MGNPADEEARIASLQALIAGGPESVPARLELGKIFRLRGRVAEAREQFEKVVELEPGNAEAHVHWAYTLLVMGEWGRGFEEYEWRWKSAVAGKKRHAGKPEWRGEEISGQTLLLYQEQGLGDAIQFMRYVPELVRRGIKVVVECDRALVDLVARMPEVAAVRAEGEALPAFDFQLALTALARVMGTTPERVPWAGAYVYVEKRKAESWGRRMREGTGVATEIVSPGKPEAMRVGLCWAGNPGHRQDKSRSVRLEMLKPLLQTGIDFFSLQTGEGAKQLKEWEAREGGAAQRPASAAAEAGHPAAGDPSTPPIVDLSGRLKTLDDVAAVIENLDLVITVDTAVAHLAGAMGKPVWVLIYMPPDWRWLLEGEKSGWYPSMRLFRQNVPGEWAGAIEAMAAALKEWVALEAPRIFECDK